LPSRGGEGLPRLLLEAAACGRPIVTTDVPGCADFVLHRQTGLVVPANNAGLLADAIAELAAEEQLRQRMGEAGRARVLAGYTERHAADAAASAWRALLEPC
jgi:glycosyltransferase involved in cell wall biosynthesis